MGAAVELGRNPVVSKHQIQPGCGDEQILRRERGQGKMSIFLVQPTTSIGLASLAYPVDPYALGKCVTIHIYAYIIQYIGRNPASKHQIQSEYGDEQADAGQDCRTRLARPNFQARTGTGKCLFSLLFSRSRGGLVTLPG